MTSAPESVGVRAIAADAWSIRLALESPLLSHVHVYALRLAGGGVLLIDCGWDDPRVLEQLEAALRSIGAALDDVRGVAVTHFHPDHYGLAGRIASRIEAWVGLAPEEAARVAARGGPVAPLRGRASEWLRRLGAPEDEIPGMMARGPFVREYEPANAPSVVIEPGDTIDAPGWDLVAVATPGHTAGHLSFVDHGRRIDFCGDHVLAGSVPAVPLHPESGPSPLQEQLSALERTIQRGEGFAGYAGHGRPIPDVAARARQLIDAYRERVDTVLALVEGRDTAWHIATRFPFAEPWESITGYFRRTVVSEVLAALVLLEAQGSVVRVDGPVVRWSRVAR